MAADHDARTESLKRDVRLLAAAVGVVVDGSGPVIPIEVVELAQDGRRTEAIRRLRATHRVGLVAAKRIVEAAAAESPAHRRD
jgi:ribosomal protein L7/L12